jgi:deoxyribodipyrimidine photo-lyase
VPELAPVPDPFLHEPWRWPGASSLDYPSPVVDHVASARAARDALQAVRKRADHGRTADAIAAKHGSRKAGIPMTGRTAKAVPKPDHDAQLTLDL